MSPPVRLIATDLDGTLLGPDDEISPRTLAALRAVREAGIHVVAATGRSHWTARPRLAPASDVIEWAICSNGAVVYDLVGDARAHVHGIAAEPLNELFSRTAAVDGFVLGWETTAGFGCNPRFGDLQPWAPSTFAAARLPDDHLPSEALKVYVVHEQLRDDELLGEVRALLPGGLTLVHGGAPFVEVTGEGVDKAFAVAILCDELGIDPTEVMAFGDNRNDLTLLGWAGHSYAMDNAHPELHEVARHRAPHHAEHGVAQVLESLVA